MTNEQFNKTIGQLRSQKQKLLNETYWWVSIARASLDKALTDKDFKDKLNIEVPSRKKTKTITRTREQIEQIITRAKDKDLYFSIYVFVIAQVEDFFSELIYLILTKDNRRVKCTVSGIDFIRKYDVVDIVDASSKNEIIDQIIQKNIATLFYSSPQKQREYFQTALGINLPNEYWDKWFEYKATRDIIVHNSGKINKVYLTKAGDLARGVVGQTITIEDQYFAASISTMKSIIGKCEVLAKQELKTLKNKKNNGTQSSRRP